MKIEQLMTRLDASWPFGSTEAMHTASHDYRAVLAKFEGSRLFAAWDATISEWKRATRPLPADILAQVMASQPRHGDGRKLDWGAVKGRQKQLIEAWWIDFSADVEAFMTGFESSEDRSTARAKVADLVTNLAWIEAQRQINLGLSPQSITLATEDWNRIAGQISSQRGWFPKRLADLDRPTPRYVREHYRAPAAEISHATACAANETLPDGRPEPPPAEMLEAFA